MKPSANNGKPEREHGATNSSTVFMDACQMKESSTRNMEANVALHTRMM